VLWLRWSDETGAQDWVVTSPPQLLIRMLHTTIHGQIGFRLCIPI